MSDKELKIHQRKQGIAGRKGLPAELKREYSKLITERLLKLEAYERACTILSYQPFGGEVDTGPFNHAAEAMGKRLAYPISEAEGILVPAVPKGPDSWAVGKFGICAPLKDKSLIISPGEIDLAIVPCTAFCAVRLMRVGMGAGYYDRFLPKCQNALTVAVAFEVQRIDNLHCDSWDVPLDRVVSEKAVYGGLTGIGSKNLEGEQ